MRVRLIELGKYRAGSSFTDYSVLSYSDKKIFELLFPNLKAYTVFDNLKAYSVFEKEILGFPEKTYFKDGPRKDGQGNKAITLFRYPNNSYFFVQIHRRKEAELLQENQVGGRPYNQYRAIFLDEEEIQESIRSKQALFISLVYDQGGEIFALRTFSDSEITNQPQEVELAIQKLNDKHLENHRELIEYCVNALLTNIEKNKDIQKSVTVFSDTIDLRDKLESIDWIQYFVFPFLGIISFSFDSVTKKKVDIKVLKSPGAVQAGAYYFDSDQREVKWPLNYFEYLSNLSENDYSKLLKYYQSGVSLFESIQLTMWKSLDLSQAVNTIAKGSSQLGKGGLFEELVSDILDDSYLIALLGSPNLDPIAKKTVMSCKLSSVSSLSEYMRFHLNLPDEIKTQEVYKHLLMAVNNFADSVAFAENSTGKEQLEIFQALASIPVENYSAHDLQILNKIFHHDQGRLFSEIEKSPARNEILGKVKKLVLANSLLEVKANYLALIYKASPFSRQEYDIYLDVLDKKNDQRSTEYLKVGEDELKSIYELGSAVAISLKIEKSAFFPSLANWKKLRKLFIDVSKTNPAFAAWWFFSELFYIGLADFGEDYLTMTQYYSDENRLKNKKLAFCFQGVRTPGLSFISLVNTPEHRNPQDSLIAILDVWLKMNFQLAPEELEFLMDENFTKINFLSKVFKSKKQYPVINSISPEKGADLLRYTKLKGIRNSLFLENGVDTLFNSLSKLNTVNNSLVEQVLLHEELSYYKTWKNYIETAHAYFKKLGSNISKDLLVLKSILDSIELQSYQYPISRTEAKLLTALLQSELTNDLDATLVEQIRSYAVSDRLPLASFCKKILSNVDLQEAPSRIKIPERYWDDSLQKKGQPKNDKSGDRQSKDKKQSAGDLLIWLVEWILVGVALLIIALIIRKILLGQ